MKIEKISGLPPAQRKIQKRVNPIIDAVNRGIVVETSDIIPEIQADGRVKLALSPAIKQQLGLE